jgi:hypothetical protein
MRIASMLIMAALVAAPVAAKGPSTRERGEAELAKDLKGYVPGKQVDCVNLHEITNQTVVDGTAIIFWGLGGKAWVNRPKGAEFLNDDNILITKPFGSQHCRLDIIHQRDRFTHMQGPAIAFDSFTLYTKPKGVK